MKNYKSFFHKKHAVLVFGIVLCLGFIFVGFAQNTTPWRTQEGRACIDQWMQLAISRLNSADLGPNYNIRKPWRFNQYGLLMGKGMYSNYAPDNFHKYEGKHHVVWLNYNQNLNGWWTGSYSFLNRAKIPSCKSFVNSCLARISQPDRQTPTPNPGGNVYYIQSFNYPDRYIRHRNALGEITILISQLDKNDASFRLVPGLADNRYVSLESINFPGCYLRHQYSRIKLHRRSNDALFRNDATFKIVRGLANNSWISFESYNYPGRYIRHRHSHLYCESGNTALFRKDATFRVVSPW